MGWRTFKLSPCVFSEFGLYSPSKNAIPSSLKPRAVQGLRSCDCVEAWRQENNLPMYNLRVQVNEVERAVIKLELAL